MTAVGITENVKGDVKKFEIWYSGREEVYVIQAPSVEVKMAWLNELRRILTNQQKLLKDEAYQHSQLVERVPLSPLHHESRGHICEGLEEWSGGRDHAHPSDTDDEAIALSPGRYRALDDCLRNGIDNVSIKCGDVLQLQHVDNQGLWLVKNLSRRQEGLVPSSTLQLILGDSSKGHSSRLGDPGNLKVRKLSSP
ncbi:hypothetical protein CRUP_015929 [Coryphaenoides rupestris]|nr:hypothetical protein CRUP_015929 [Coryphaenoides rupestris]